MLTIPVQQKGRERQVVQAGQQHLFALPAARKEQVAGGGPVDPLQKADPWMEYYSRQGSKGSGNLVPPSQQAPARAMPEDGPISQKFRAQDSRLQSLEETVRSLQEGQVAAEKQRQQDQDAVSANFASLSQQFAVSLEAMQRAQHAQQEQLVQSMHELKTLVLSAQVPADPTKKRPATGEEQSMEWEQGRL